MKLYCIACGTPDTILDGGKFVCRSCGSRYDPSDFRKRRQSGSAAAVSAEPGALYAEARSAKDGADSAAALGFYERILELEPDSPEATFYSAYYRAELSGGRDVIRECEDFTSALEDVFSLTASYVPSGRLAAAVAEIAERCGILTGLFAENADRDLFEVSTHIHESAGKGYPPECTKTDTLPGYAKEMSAALGIMYACCELAYLYFSDVPGMDGPIAGIWKQTYERYKDTVVKDDPRVSGLLSSIALYDPEYVSRQQRQERIRKLQLELKDTDELLNKPPLHFTELPAGHSAGRVRFAVVMFCAAAVFVAAGLCFGLIWPYPVAAVFLLAGLYAVLEDRRKEKRRLEAIREREIKDKEFTDNMQYLRGLAEAELQQLLKEDAIKLTRLEKKTESGLEKLREELAGAYALREEEERKDGAG